MRLGRIQQISESQFPSFFLFFPTAVTVTLWKMSERSTQSVTPTIISPVLIFVSAWNPLALLPVKHQSSPSASSAAMDGREQVVQAYLALAGAARCRRPSWC